MKIEREIYNRLKDISKLKDPKPKLKELLQEVKPYSYRSRTQNNALHKFCSLLAEEMNTSGKEMRLVLKGDVPIWWTTTSVKDYIWRPVMKAMTGKESTTKLSKTEGEIDVIHKQIMQWLGERHGIEYIPFPSNEEY